MADNINIKDSGGTVVPVSTAETSSLNGVTVPSVEVQRLKTGYGTGGTHQDVDAAHPLPTADAAVLAKLTSDPATQTTLAAVLAKLSSDPATQTTLAAVLAKLSADPSTGANQTAAGTKLDTLHTDLTGGGARIGGTVVTKGAGTYGYAAGTATGNVDVPTGARITRVSVLAGSSAGATVTILGGNTITIPVGAAFDENISGDALATSAANEVVLGGTVQSYYVAWAV